MRICAACLLRRAAPPFHPGKPAIFMSRRCSLIPSLRLHGPGFAAQTAFSMPAMRLTGVWRLRPTKQNALWRMHRS